MKTTLILVSIATLVSVLLFACTPKLPTGDSAKETTKETKTAPTNANDFGQTLSLKYGEEILVGSENLKIAFREIQDSRCPKSVNCMTEGKAKLQFQIQGKDINESVQLVAKGLCTKTDGSCGEVKKVKHYKVQLINVYPFPIEKTGPKEDNIAKIMIIK